MDAVHCDGRPALRWTGRRALSRPPDPNALATVSSLPTFDDDAMPAIDRLRYKLQRFFKIQSGPLVHMLQLFAAIFGCAGDEITNTAQPATGY